MRLGKCNRNGIQKQVYRNLAIVGGQMGMTRTDYLNQL